MYNRGIELVVLDSRGSERVKDFGVVGSEDVDVDRCALNLHQQTTLCS